MVALSLSGRSIISAQARYARMDSEWASEPRLTAQVCQHCRDIRLGSPIKGKMLKCDAQCCVNAATSFVTPNNIAWGGSRVVFSEAPACPVRIWPACT